jgi:hypothetical protein
MFTLVNAVIGFFAAVVLGVLFLLGLPFLIMAVIALVAFAILAAILGLAVGLLKLALFVVVPVLVVFWVVKAVFGWGRRRTTTFS